MRTSLLFLACLPAALAQDAPDTAPRYTFSVEQGWTLGAEIELDFPDIQENDLQAGLSPRFKPPITGPTFQMRDRDGKVQPHHRGIPPLRRSCDPIKLEGSIAILPDGSCRLQFRKIEYWDRSQRYWIEFQADKIRTHDLGGVEKWSGSRAEWTARLEKLQEDLQAAYLRVVTPQKPAAAADRLGFEGPTGSEPAWRLFVTGSLEEQMAALLLARMDGVRLDDAAWPADVPERARAVARGLVDRIQFQARGAFAPEPARAHPGRALKAEAWKGDEVAIPTLGWSDGSAWAVERVKPVNDARARLRALADDSGRSTSLRREAFMEPEVWQTAVEDEAKKLRKAFLLAVPERAGTLEDSLLPRILNAGPGTYEFKEKTEVKDGVVRSSDADVRGTIPALEVAFFHSGWNAWRRSTVRLETSYKGKVSRD